MADKWVRTLYYTLLSFVREGEDYIGIIIITRYCNLSDVITYIIIILYVSPRRAHCGAVRPRSWKVCARSSYRRTEIGKLTAFKYGRPIRSIRSRKPEDHGFKHRKSFQNPVGLLKLF